MMMMEKKDTVKSKKKALQDGRVQKHTQKR